MQIVEQKVDPSVDACFSKELAQMMELNNIAKLYWRWWDQDEVQLSGDNST